MRSFIALQTQLVLCFLNGSSRHLFLSETFDAAEFVNTVKTVLAGPPGRTPQILGTGTNSISPRRIQQGGKILGFRDPKGSNPKGKNGLWIFGLLYLRKLVQPSTRIVSPDTNVTQALEVMLRFTETFLTPYRLWTITALIAILRHLVSVLTI